jgi:uncharacterized membrane protein YkvA (DUF1232 family)
MDDSKESKYDKHYSNEGFWLKLRKNAKEAGLKVVYSGLILYYALESPNTPKRVKFQIYGALGYLIFPFDIVTDLLPGVGFVDDLGVLIFALGKIAMNIDDEVKRKAKEKLLEFFGEIALRSQDVIDVDAQIKKDGE